jgi:hypothetical protein
MNKIIFVMSVLFSQMAFAQQTKTPITTIENPSDCPLGMCPMAYISLDALNFHKPRTNCAEGFGLCIKISWGVTCTSCFGKSAVSGSSIKMWSVLKENAAELHIPLGLKNQKGFEKVNFTQFEMDDNSMGFQLSNGKIRYAKGGIYNTTIKDNEYVITVSLN